MAFIWSEIHPAGNVNKYWTGVAMSYTGQYVVACALSINIYTPGLYTSSDYGATWVTQTPVVGGSWSGVACDLTGAHIVALNNNGYVYTSDDYGSHWNQRDPAGGIRAWYCVCSNSDGSRIYVGGIPTSVYVSTDHGVSWTRLINPYGFLQDTDHFSLSCSADGLTLIDGLDNYEFGISYNGGISWNFLDIPGISNINNIWGYTSALNGGGNKFLCGFAYHPTDGGFLAGQYIYYSNNLGVSYSLVTSIANDTVNSFMCTSSDLSGTNLLAGLGQPGRLWISSDGGNSWLETGPTVGVNQMWAVGAFSGDGSIAIAGIVGGRLYTTYTFPTTTTTTTPAPVTTTPAPTTTTHSPTPPPIFLLSISANPSQGRSPLTTIISSISSNPLNTLKWYINDVPQPDVTTRIRLTFIKSGIYTIKLVATDIYDSGPLTATTLVLVTSAISVIDSSILLPDPNRIMALEGTANITHVSKVGVGVNASVVPNFVNTGFAHGEGPNLIFS